MKKLLAFLFKWLYCSWAHYKYRCYPTVWGAEDAIKLKIPYRPDVWHCKKCHDCSEGLKDMLGKND